MRSGSLRLCGRYYRVDLDPVEGDGGLDLEDVADLGPVGQHRPTRPLPGAPGHRRPPRPRSVRARAGELDVDPTRHGNRNLPAGGSACETAFRPRPTPRPPPVPPRYRRLVPIYALGGHTPDSTPRPLSSRTPWPRRSASARRARLATRGCGATAAGGSRPGKTSVEDCSVSTRARHPTSSGTAAPSPPRPPRGLHHRGRGLSARPGPPPRCVVDRGATWRRTRSCSTAPPSPRARRPLARQAPQPGGGRPREIEHGREVYVAKGRDYREGLRRIG